MFVEVAAVAAEAATVAGLFKAAARLRSVCSHTLVDVVTMSVHKMAFVAIQNGINLFKLFVDLEKMSIHDGRGNL